MNEVWKEIKGWEGLYEVSGIGRVKSLPKKRIGDFNFGEKILKNCKNKKGYLCVCLHRNNRQKTITIHRLVAIAFIPNPENKPEVNHRFGNKTDNFYKNLEWATTKENIQHAWENGLCGGNQFNKKVMQIKNNKVIKIWESIKKAGEYCGNKGHISSCCCGNRKSSGGFQWKHI